MQLILSAAYLDPEFISEIGLIPPSFLPIGNKRLFEYQYQLLRHNDLNSDIYISIPESFCLDHYDEQVFHDTNVNILRVPDDMALGEAILYCWNSTGKQHSSLTLLHGDTLYLDAKFKTENGICVHKDTGTYRRGKIRWEIDHSLTLNNDLANIGDEVISGYFKFSQPLDFMRSLVKKKYNFTDAIADYHSVHTFDFLNDGIWLDFGHLNSFYQSRTVITTERYFNKISVNQNHIEKSSNKNSKKICAEGMWFKDIPSNLRLYTPALLELNDGSNCGESISYKLEYMHLMPLSDLYVFGRLSSTHWSSIFRSIADMLSEFSSYKPDKKSMLPPSASSGLYLTKTEDRLDEYFSSSDIAADKKWRVSGHDHLTLFDIAKESSRYINELHTSDVSVVHGDLCLSNILFDVRSMRVKCIDPRGLDHFGNITIFGDRRYDLAKLYQSVVGLYDFIVAERVKLYFDGTTKNSEIYYNESDVDEIQSIFKNTILHNSKYTEKEILAITVQLFLSMLPLHADNKSRQTAFILTAVKLFQNLVGNKL